MSRDAKDDLVFKALAHPVRRGLLDHLRDQPKTTGALCDAYPELDRCTVMQHLKVLGDSNLILARREGRERWNHLNALPIKAIYDRWISQYADHAISILDKMKNELG